MSYVSIQDEVQVIFEESTSKYVIHKDNKKPPLLKIQSLPIDETVTIDIIKDIMKGIIYVQQKMLTYKPSQIFKEHIVRNDENWAISNIICYRNKSQKSWEGNYGKYNPTDFDYHLNEQNELVWSIGVLWFELLTKKKLPSISKINQDVMNSQIENNIKNLLITSILKNILVTQKEQRITFAELMAHSIFQIQPQETQVSLINFISKIHVIGKSAKNIEPFNPFQEKIFQRDLKQALAISKLFDKVKAFIKDRFELEDRDQIEFSLYLIDLKLYFRMKSQEQERESKRFNIVLLEEKDYYSAFAKKLLQLQNIINRKRKRTKFSKFKNQYGSTLCSISQMNKENVYKHFKSYLVSYAKLLAHHRKDPKYLRWIIAILLIRCSDYVFSNARRFLFQDFIEEQTFNLQSVIENILKCVDHQKLKQLEKKIIDFYFT